jgi:DNA repair protein RadC
MATSHTITRRRSTSVRDLQTAVLPVSGVSDSVLSFQYGLRARERATVDRALKIVGGELRRRDVFSSPALARQYINLQLAGEPCEKFAVLHLDTQNRAIAFDVMFTGTLNQATVHPREVVCAALAHHSAGVILAHNHPSGAVKPSKADINLTETLKAALSLVEVRVLDHIIVARGAVLSMMEQGLM